MFRNMITSLLDHERIQTTVAKAKEARRFADKMVTLAKKNTLHTRRRALAYIMDKQVVSKLFTVLGPRYAGRNGGYTRIIRTGFRQGDGAELAILEMVGRIAPTPKAEKKKTKKAKQPQQPEKTPRARKKSEPPAEPTPEE